MRTPEEADRQRERDKKEHYFLSISATVFAHQITELRWQCEGGEQVHAYSNLDFTHLAGIGSFETADAVYSLVMAVGDESSQGEVKAQRMKALPRLDQFPKGYTSYLLDAKADTSEAQKACEAMDALHAYYDANREQLTQAHQQRETARAIRERWHKEHPPVPKDTVIHFWRKTPTAPGTPSKGGAKKP